MKKILLFASAIVGLFLTSCQQENLEPVAGKGQVTFTIEAPAALQTKAIADGLNVDELIYEVWITGATPNQEDLSNATRLYQARTDMVQDGDRMKANITLDLVNDQNFTVLFWAQKSGLGVYKTEWLNAVTYNNLEPEAYLANDGQLDAFYSKAFVSDGVTSTPTVTLRRPFAQVNLCTLNNKEAAQTPSDYNIALSQSKMLLDAVPTVFNVATSAATKYVAMEFAYNAVPSGDDQMITVNGKEYYYAGMNYVFAGANIALTYDIATKLNSTVDANVNNTIANVPLKENHRTNIVGNLLTSKVDYEIIVDAAFDAPEHVIGDEWSQTGDYKYSVNVGASATVLADVLAHADAEARIAATKAAGPVVTIDLAENVEWVTGAGIGSTPLLPEDSPISAVVINGNGKTFTATGQGVGTIRLANGGLLTFNNVKVVDLSVSYAENSWEYGYLEFAGNLAFNDCEFVNAIMVEGETAAFANSTFNSHEDNQYAVWVNEGATSFTGCTFAGARGLKVHEAYGSEVASVVVDDCLFTELTKKPGIALGDLNAETSITIKNSTFDRCQAGDQKNYMYETDTDVTTFTFVRENNLVIPSGDGVVEQEDGSVVVSTAAGLQAALAAATGETTIVLGANIEGYVTVVQKPGVKITIEGLENTYNGSIKVHSSSNHYADAALTIKNVNFETSVASNNVIEALENGAERYSTNITVDNCTFTATGEAVNTSVGVQIKSSKWAKVLNCTATNMHSLIQAQSCDETVVVNGCTINGKNGVAFKQVKAATVEGTAITALEYGIRFDGNTDNYGIIVKNNNVTAVQPLIVRKMTGKNNTITLEGANTLTTEELYQIVITNGSDDAAYVEPTGTYTLTGADNYVVFPRDNYGEKVANGLYKNAKNYYVANAEGLVALSSIKLAGGENVNLIADIDLTGVEFNGLGAFHSENNNAFDGQGHTVSNWTNHAKLSDLGFVKNWVGPIKNLTIKNASLKTAGRSGIIAGNVYSNIENCHVVDCTLEDSYWACGLIAGLYNAGSVTNCSATNSTVKSNGGTGAIVGVVNESAGTRSFTNCVVTGCTVNNTGAYGEAYSGALVCGMINITNSTVEFVGCQLGDNNTKTGKYVGDLYYAADEDITIVVK